MSLESALRWGYRSDEAIPIMGPGFQRKGPMPLTPHEQRILEEIERRLAEEDPRLVESVSKATVATHALRRIRWGLVGFVIGFVMLLLFVASIWFAVAGFVLMLGSGLVVYQHLRRMGRDQLQSHGQQGGHLSVTAALARLAERLRRPRGPN
jgi:ABC-type bacteriocin/lantibiotic exporter with double-glycine peptidase domain